MKSDDSEIGRYAYSVRGFSLFLSMDVSKFRQLVQP